MTENEGLRLIPSFAPADRPLGNRTDLIPVDMTHFAPSFISSPLYNKDRVDFLYYHSKKEHVLYADIYFGTRSMGPPDHVHGGCLMAILDEAMGILPWLLGHPVVSVNVNVDLIQMTPIGSWGIVKVEIDRIDTRKILTRATIHNLEGDLLVRAKGVYVIVPSDKFGDIEIPLFNHLGNIEQTDHS